MSPALLLLTACIDYNPAGKPADSVDVVEPDTGTESGETRDSGDTADPLPTPEEVCDGIDNDGDGAVDEAFPDADGDTIADCVDATCAVSLDSEEPVFGGHACVREVPEPAEPWNVEMMWAASDEIECEHPVVADLDADGRPEILCPSHYTDAVWVLDGATGAIEARWEAFTQRTHLTIADLDRDGNLDVAGIDQDFYPIAVDPRGREIWRGAMPLAQRGNSYSLEVRDLDGNGTAEVLSQRGAVRGVDGSSWANFDPSTEARSLEFQIAVDDFDGDAVAEIAYVWRAWNVASGLMWDHTPYGTDHGFWTPMPVQADTDDDAELAWVTMNNLLVVDIDGSVLMHREFGVADRMYANVACAGDIDGDGAMEAFSAGLDNFNAFSLEGHTHWTVPMLDLTPNWGGCTTFDFDLDGAKEVVAVDQDALYILDGSTGATLYYGTDGFDSSTVGDIPIVVDLDGDGSVEILVPSPANSYGTQLHAWRNVNRDWPPGTTMWPSTAWSGTSLLPDGRVPRTPHKPWLTTKVWRGQPELPVFGSDLVPDVGDVCVASCEDDGEVRVEVRLQNRGPDEVEAGVPLAVYGLDEGGTRVLLTVFTLGDWLDDGRAAASWEVVTTTAQAERGLVFVAGDDGTGTTHADDCATENSTVSWALATCP